MEQLHRLTKQAYSQSPWRSQTQFIVVFLLAVVASALVAFIYLNTTAQAAMIGRQIQEMQVNLQDAQDIELADVEALPGEAQDESQQIEEVVPIEILRMQIAVLETQLATLTSLDRVREEADKAGMVLREAENVMYLAVPGYTGEPVVNLAPAPRVERVESPALPEVYKQSLIDWLKMQIVSTSKMLMDEVKP